MTKYTPEIIKNRLSNIGEAIGSIALEYIVKLEKENAILKKEIEAITKNRDELLNEISRLEDCVAELRECY